MDLNKLTASDLEQLQQLDSELEALAQKQKFNKIDSIFPDTGPYARDKYPKHMDFIEEAKYHRLCGFVGANGTGKSLLGSYLTYLHMSGKYPENYQGFRFNQGPLKGWMASIEGKQIRAVQEHLFGSAIELGTGIIPRAELLDDNGHMQVTMLPGVSGCVGVCYIRHYNAAGKFDGYSMLEFKTYEQGWKQFQGANRNWIWLDEEPEDPKVYAECLARTRGPEGREGRMLCTFTPTLGWSTIYLLFCPDGKVPENGIQSEQPELYTKLVTIHDVPHLSESWKKSAIEQYKKTDPMNLMARTMGQASMGSGKIYPVEESFFIIKRFEIPDYWPRAYCLDYGYHNTAAVWIAQDPVTKRKVAYAEYKRGGVHDAMHVMAIKSKGDWIPGICDPHSGHRDGGELRVDYFRSQGLDITNGSSNPAAGIAMILNDLQSGQLQIMEDLTGLIQEIRTYRWDPNNPSKPADKQDDHILDSMRYYYSKYEWVAKCQDDEFNNSFGRFSTPMNTSRNGADDLTGY